MINNILSCLKKIHLIMNYIQENCCFCIKELESIRIKIQDCSNNNIMYISKLKHVFQDLIIPPHICLPISICYICCENLKRAYEFKQQCFRSLNYWNELRTSELTENCVETSKVKIEADPLLIEHTDEGNNDTQNVNKSFTVKIKNDDGIEEHIKDVNKTSCLKSIPLNMNYIQGNCCFCVKELESTKIKIQDCSNDNITYISKLKYMFQDVIIPPHIYLPISVCSMCCENLEQAYEFKQQCFRSLNYWNELRTPEICPQAKNCVDTNKVKTEADPLLIENIEEGNNDTQNVLNVNKVFTLKSEIKIENDDGTEEHIKDDNLELESDIIYNNTCKSNGYVLNSTLTCDFCQTTCANLHALKQHLSKTHPNSRNYECETCGRNFSQEGRLQMHLLVHTDEKNFECSYCHNKYKTEPVLDRHVRREHTKEKKVNKCDLCGLICKTKSGLYHHTQKHKYPKTRKKTIEERNYVRNISYETRELLYPCEICIKSFASEKSLSRHMRHHNRKSHKCKICAKGFVSSSVLKSHLTCHSDEKNYKCTKCSKTFKSQGNLTTHMDVHLNREHTCAICNKTFSNLSTYYTHKTTHRQKEDTKVKNPSENIVFVGPKLPHACESCPKSFSDHAKLRQHRQAHSLNKNFVCSHCGKCFVTLGALKKHLETHVTDRCYSCNQCEKKFKTEATLKTHKKKYCKPVDHIHIKLEQTENSDSTSLMGICEIEQELDT